MKNNAFLLVTLGCLGLVAQDHALAQDDIDIVDPGRGSPGPVAAIDDERFELGLFTGSLSVEDFGSSGLAGVELGYHLSPRWLIQASYGQSEVDEATFERGDRRFLAEEDRDFEYFAIVAGYRIFDGRSFFRASNKFNSYIYLLAGPEHVSFADNDEWGLNFGLSYRLVLTDWLTANVDFREHMFERDFIGDEKQTLNTEFRIGFNALF